MEHTSTCSTSCSPNRFHQLRLAEATTLSSHFPDSAPPFALPLCFLHFLFEPQPLKKIELGGDFDPCRSLFSSTPFCCWKTWMENSRDPPHPPLPRAGLLQAEPSPSEDGAGSQPKALAAFAGRRARQAEASWSFALGGFVAPPLFFQSWFPILGFFHGGEGGEGGEGEGAQIFPN